MSQTSSAKTLIQIQDLADPGAISVVRGVGNERIDILVVHRNGKVWGYQNACPHQGTPLETLDGRFFTRDEARLLCSTHGAEFRLTDGLCVKGPCKGKSLRPIHLEVDKSGDVRQSRTGARPD